LIERLERSIPEAPERLVSEYLAVRDVNRELVVRFRDALRRGEPEEAARCFHREYRSNSWGGDLMATWEKMQAWSAAGVITHFETHAEHLVSEGDRVVAYTHFSATHSGELFGVPATGKRFDLHNFEMWRVQDGKLIEHWGGVQEAVRLFEQLTE
jgi:predicted ester cyclase